MPDEFDLDLEDVEGQEEKPHPIDRRIKKALTDREQALAEKAEVEKAKAEEEKKRLEAEKERDFYKTFTPLTVKYQGAADYQDKILEKVRAGYDVEDATISTLAKEGKFTAPAPVPAPKDSPIGGSATTAIQSEAEKPLAEMTTEEKRAALVELERKGDLSTS